jgi:hypothetical protein
MFVHQIDHGHIFELDSNNVCARALMRAASASSGFEVNPQQSLTSGQGASTNSQRTHFRINILHRLPRLFQFIDSPCVCLMSFFI